MDIYIYRYDRYMFDIRHINGQHPSCALPTCHSQHGGAEESIGAWGSAVGRKAKVWWNRHRWVALWLWAFPTIWQKKSFGKRHEVLIAGAIVNGFFRGFVGFELAPGTFFVWLLQVCSAIGRHVWANARREGGTSNFVQISRHTQCQGIVGNLNIRWIPIDYIDVL